MEELFEEMPETLTTPLLPAIVLVVFAVSLWRFVRRWRTERRSLWLGVSFVMTLGSFVLLIGATLMAIPGAWGAVAIYLILGVSFALLLELTPFILAFVGIVTGVNLIRREGPRFGNVLSLGAGICTIIYLLFWPGLFRRAGSYPVLDYLTVVFAFAVSFTSLLFVAYVITSWLNQLPQHRRRYDHVVVLGCGLRPDGTPTPLLQGRIKKGIEVWRQNPGSRLVMSGGKGDDEIRPEAAAMRQWAIEQGVPASEVMAEERSVNTHQNLTFSWQLMRERDGEPGNVVVVSDDYHVYRALLLAKHLGFACDGRGAKVKLYFSLNALVREFVAFIVIWKRRYLTALAIGALVPLVRLLLVTLISTLS